MGIQFMQAIPNDGKVGLTKTPDRFELSVEIKFNAGGWAGIQIGVDERGAGYALAADAATESVHFMELKNGSVLLDRGLKRAGFETGIWYPLRARYDGRVLKVWFNINPLDKDPWPIFEFELDLPGRLSGTDAGRDIAEFRGLRVTPLDPAAPEEADTFTNPVTIGADPDILYHNGLYYLYNRVPNDPNSSEDAYLYSNSEHASLDRAGDKNAIFRVSSSPDLVHWSPHTPMFYREGVLEGAFCMSPNVFYKDGLFYLLFAAGRINGDESFHIYYAVADSPMGPFKMRTDKPLHRDAREIGGMPFVDEDGQCYITYVRFDRGNHIWLQRMDVKDGVITPDDATLVHILSPQEDYEVDEHGRIVEGGVIIPHKGHYYMIYADGHYLGHYGESYLVSKCVYGPYIRYAHNPILNHNFRVDGAGDGVVAYNADKTEMVMAYHRHISADAVEPRMTCLDRMKFVPDPNGGPDILTVYGPTTTPQPIPFRKRK